MGPLTSFLASLVLLTALSLPGNCQDCASQMSCGDCLATVDCSWCSLLNFPGTRCSMNLTGCNAMDGDGIETSTGMINNIQLAEPGVPISNRTNPVSVTNVNLTLGVGIPQTFSVTITPLRNLPLDLYVLLDVSGSLTEELASLRNLAGDLANSIADVTTNVRVGFGSFNDKVTRPYTYFLEPNSDGTCQISPSHRCRNYAFRHQITLTNDTNLFTERLQPISNVANADQPENGLEALAQVVACEDIIGWRSRQADREDRGLIRIVLYMTDQGFHYSGEGQFAGILKPYRGECLLEPPEPGQLEVEFTKWDEVDYPSVGQIVQMLNESQVGVIFAIQGPRMATYENLERLIDSHFRASVAALDGNGSNILTLIDEEARRFLQTVELDPGVSDDLMIQITPSCPAGTNFTGRGCDGVQLERMVDFDVTVTLKNCNNFRNANAAPRTHQLTAQGFGGFTLTYTGDCVCDCAAENLITVDSPRCSGNGNFVCGVCECNDGFCGTSCELKIGSACDCDRLTDDCPRTNGTICSGQGACCDGMCVCRENENGYLYRNNGTRGDCACQPEEVVCRDPMNRNRTCVNGVCGCSRCECESMFAGPVCDTRTLAVCNDPMDLMCLQACEAASFDEAMCMACEPTRPLLTFDGSSGVEPRDRATELARQHRDDDSFAPITDCLWTSGNCEYDYFTLRNSEQIVILVLNTNPVCTSPAAITLPFPAWVFIFIVIGVLLILGVIIFVLIKIIISILDYLEVKKWERETKEADFSKNQNPLYQSPEMKYENVAYGRE